MKSILCINIGAILLVGVIAKPGSRIIGGQNAAAGEFPYAAAITVQTEGGRHFCGGAFTDSQFVITSASCIYGGTLFTIQLGSATLSTADPNRVTVATSEYFVHPDFDPETLHADIGLIKLRMNVTHTDYIKGATWLIGDVSPGTTVKILGWGQTSDQTPELSEHLQYVETTALSNDECKIYYGSQIDDGMVCVAGNYNEGTCTGDNGGPLLESAFNRYYLVGVASFISGNGCESTNPSGYTRVSPYYIWLRSILRGEE